MADEQPAVEPPASGWQARLAFVLLPLLGLTAFTAVFRCTSADMAISKWFYDAAAGEFPGLEEPLWVLLYDFGAWPALLLGIGGGLLALISLVRADLAEYRPAGLFLALCVALGPGLAVNGIFKPQWKRPRPNQVVQFGGQESFTSVWSFGSRDDAKSFPCGHASMGFCLLAPAFLLFRRAPRWAIAILLFGLAFGCLMGLARVAQGRHFASDVLWSGGMVYLIALGLHSGMGWLGAWDEPSATADRDDSPSDESPAVVPLPTPVWSDRDRRAA